MPKTVEKGISEIVGCLTDPIIAWPGGWMDTIPEKVKQQITMERLVMCMKAAKGELPTGTDAEALAYMYPRTMEAPLGRDWTDIYLYLGTKVMAGAGSEIPKDIRRDSLDDDLMSKLNHLKAWIYQKRIQARLDRARAERRQKKEEEATQREEAQPALFDFK
jgi:hypothetical protein